MDVDAAREKNDGKQDMAVCEKGTCDHDGGWGVACS